MSFFRKTLAVLLLALLLGAGLTTDFVQAAGVSVMSPKAGDSLERNQPYMIFWMGARQANIYLLKNGAAIATVPTTSVTTNPAGLSSVSWTVPAQLATGGNYQIKVEKRDQPNVFGLSGTFSITEYAQPGFEVLSPTANTVAGAAGNTLAIRWQYTKIAYPQEYRVSIALTPYSGPTRQIATKIPLNGQQHSSAQSGTGQYNWRIPNDILPGQPYWLAVSAEYISTGANMPKFGSSKPVTFINEQGSASGDYIEVRTPTASSSWMAGTTQTINWRYNAAITGTVDIEYRAGSGDKVIARGVPIGTNGAGSYSWQIPADICRQETDVLLTIKNSLNPAVKGFVVTKIKPVTDPYIISSPAHNSVWAAGTQMRIAWSPKPGTGISGPVFVYYNRTGDSGKTQLAYVPGNANGSGEFTWTIPPNFQAGGAVITVEHVQSKAASTQSFGFAHPPQVNLTSPRDGANWKLGVTYPISWRYQSTTQDMSVKILLKTQSGTTARTIVSGLTAPGVNANGSYNWTVPSDLQSGRYYIQIEYGGHTNGGPPGTQPAIDSSGQISISQEHFRPERPSSQPNHHGLR